MKKFKRTKKFKSMPSARAGEKIREDSSRKRKVKVVYKYADEIFVDRPKTTAYPSNPLVVKAEEFEQEIVKLYKKYLTPVKRKNRALAICQLQERASIFRPTVQKWIKEELK